MWTVVYVAQSTQEAEKISGALRDNGILVKLRQLGQNKGSKAIYEVMVPQMEVEDASLVLTSMAYM
jgi:hypothetical protein